MIGIIDYGMGNLRSVQKGFEHVGAPATCVTTADQIDAADRLVLPGVGAFRDAIATLNERGLSDPIRRFVATGRPFLGICLGLQLLFESSREGGEWAGLGILPGRCVAFDVDRAMGLKVPHMGWNGLDFRRQGGELSPLFAGIPDGSAAYFVHGYHAVPSDGSVIAATTDYGRPFVSSVWRGNLVAAQFHPEKSQSVGLAMLKNFASM